MSATFYVTLEKVFQQAVWFLLFLILAPVLGPKPYGQFALAMVFIGFCEIVMLEAATEALLGMESLEHRHLGTLNLVGLSVAAVIGGFLFWPAPSLGAPSETLNSERSSGRCRFCRRSPFSPRARWPS